MYDIEKAKDDIKKLSAKIVEIETKAQSQNRDLNSEEIGWVAEAQGAIRT